MSDDQQSSDLRHDPARRRAVAGLQHEHARRSCGIARQLERLGVDVIEAGFPIASPGDFEAVQADRRGGQGRHGRGALPRARRGHRRPRRRRSRTPRRPRSTPSSPPRDIHLQHKLKMTPRGGAAPGGRGRPAARAAFAEDVEFSAEDASRTDSASCARSLQAVIEAGATTLNIPDTVGYALPDEFGARSSASWSRDRPGRRHLASTATTTSAWPSPTRWPPCTAGARQVECTINGIGERAGNTSLEEVVMALRRAPRALRRRDRRQHRADLPHEPAAVDRSPASGRSPTRRSSGATPSPTRPASTSTACSPTR